MAAKAPNMKIKAPKRKSLTPDQAKIHATFQKFDAGNNNGLLSLAEIDKAAIELMPELGAHKAALMRAYKASDKNKDGFITESEFATLLNMMSYYDQLWHLFEKADANDDGRVSFSEFKSAHEALGIKGDDKALKAEFDKMDGNQGGIVLFDEFCLHMAKKQSGAQASLAAHQKPVAGKAKVHEVQACDKKKCGCGH